MSEESDLRASDAEREQAVSALHEHSVTGRLSPDDLEARVHDAYRARTRAELAVLTADLPGPPAPRPQRSRWLRQRLASFVSVNGVCLGVWAASGAQDFWPGWVMLGTGIPLFSMFVHRMFGVEHNTPSRRSARRHTSRRRALRPGEPADHER